MFRLLSLAKAQKLLKMSGTRGKRLKTLLLGLEREHGVKLIHRLRTPKGRTQWRVEQGTLQQLVDWMRIKIEGIDLAVEVLPWPGTGPPESNHPRERRRRFTSSMATPSKRRRSRSPPRRRRRP